MDQQGSIAFNSFVIERGYLHFSSENFTYANYDEIGTEADSWHMQATNVQVRGQGYQITPAVARFDLNSQFLMIPDPEYDFIKYLMLSDANYFELNGWILVDCAL